MIPTRKHNHMETFPDGTAVLFVDNVQTRVSSFKSFFNYEINFLSANSGVKGIEILEREPQ